MNLRLADMQLIWNAVIEFLASMMPLEKSKLVRKLFDLWVNREGSFNHRRLNQERISERTRISGIGWMSLKKYFQSISVLLQKQTNKNVFAVTGFSRKRKKFFHDFSLFKEKKQLTRLKIIDNWMSSGKDVVSIHWSSHCGNGQLAAKRTNWGIRVYCYI